MDLVIYEASLFTNRYLYKMLTQEILKLAVSAPVVVVASFCAPVTMLTVFGYVHAEL